MKWQRREATFNTTVQKQLPRVFLPLLSAENQMAAGVKCSQRQIKPDNAFTPTACRNGSESIADIKHFSRA